MTFDLQDTINKLRAYENVTYPILSVYINTYHKDHPDMLRNFRHLVVDYLTDEEQEAVKKNISYIQGFLKTFPTPQTCRTLALFSGGDHLWEVITTELEIPEQIAVSHYPHIAPITGRLRNQQNYLVLLADRRKALLLKLNRGEVAGKKEVHTPDVEDEVPQNVKGRNLAMRDGKIDRHVQVHLHRHLKKIGQEVDSFLEEQPIAGVLIGGHKSLLHPLGSTLSKPIQDKILKEFIVDLNAPLNDLIEKSKKELRSSESPAQAAIH